jgi:hypothetical protein
VGSIIGHRSALLLLLLSSIIRVLLRLLVGSIIRVLHTPSTLLPRSVLVRPRSAGWGLRPPPPRSAGGARAWAPRRARGGVLRSVRSAAADSQSSTPLAQPRRAAKQAPRTGGQGCCGRWAVLRRTPTAHSSSTPPAQTPRAAKQPPPAATPPTKKKQPLHRIHINLSRRG